MVEPQKFDIEIKADGRWFHEGGEIKRMGLVKLFASVLSCDEDGRYWLTTPVERGEITVEDAPFIITRLSQSGTGQEAVITLTDNLDNEHVLSAGTPLEMRYVPHAAEPRPYLCLPHNLTALVQRPIFYEMAEIALAQSEAGDRLYSAGASFSLLGEG